MTNFFTTIGDLFQKSFKIMPKIGNKYNVAMIIVGFIALFVWLWLQTKYNKKADKEGAIR